MLSRELRGLSAWAAARETEAELRPTRALLVTAEELHELEAALMALSLAARQLEGHVVPGELRADLSNIAAGDPKIVLFDHAEARRPRQSSSARSAPPRDQSPEPAA